MALAKLIKHNMNPTSKIFADFFKDETLLSAKVEVLMDKMFEGHICVELTEEEEKSIVESKFVYKGFEKQPFVISEHNLYLQRYFYYESSILNSIHQLVNDSKAHFQEIVNSLLLHQSFINQLFKNDSANIDWQLIAALNACLHNFAIITGGPGTGKTTTVSKLLAVLLKIYPSLNIALAAPTGKAAMRMKESLSNALGYLDIDEQSKKTLEAIQPLTIHRLLGYVKDSPYFKHNAQNQLSYDLIIVDEASMIDAPMMAKLLEATRKNAKILFLGDKNQLASVEAGSVFSDLCVSQLQLNTFSSEQISFFNSFIHSQTRKLGAESISEENHFLAGLIVELQQSRRFNSEEGIGLFSKSVIEGKLIDIESWKKLPSEIQKGISLVAELQDIKPEILLYKSYIQETDILKALAFTNQIRVLCAMKEGNLGVKNTNIFIEDFLKKEGLLKPEFGFYENQLIMITANNYNLSLFNGDIGIVRKDKQTGILTAYFEDANADLGYKAIATSYIKNYETAFAMTIHKSQGSEFDTVVVLMPDIEVPILTRELLYTGITRAKSLAKIVVKQSILDFTISRQVQRSSGITKRIMNSSF